MSTSSKAPSRGLRARSAHRRADAPRRHWPDPEPNYVVLWHSRPGTGIYEREQRDEVRASNAQRAIDNVKRALAEEYAEVSTWFVPLEVIRL